MGSDRGRHPAGWLRRYLRRLVSVSLLLLAVGLPLRNPALADHDVIGLPSTSTTDGKFVGLAGQDLQTMSQAARFWIGIEEGSATLDIGVFDGNVGGLWDIHDPNNSELQTFFQLYADPMKTGDPTVNTLIASKSSADVDMRDDDWTTIYNGPVHASARSSTGHYFYLLVVSWNDPGLSANEFNSFKLRARGQVSIIPGQWGFVGAPINLPEDPPLNDAGNSYDGQWSFYLYIPPDGTTARFVECDADSRTNPVSPGSPPDDEVAPRVRIPPDIRYTINRADGQLVINNIVPSGNSVCETRSITVPAGGLFRWSWYGVDAHNLVFIVSDYETLSTDITPLPAGTATPTVTPTGTTTPTATASPTHTPTGTPTATASPTGTPVRDLSIGISHAGTFVVGETGLYTIPVSNVGGGDTLAGTTTVTVPLPVGLTYVSATGGGWTCAHSAGTVTCTRTDTLTVGASYPDIALAVLVDDAALPTVTTSARVDNSTVANDTDPTNNVASDLAPVAIATRTPTVTPTSTSTPTATPTPPRVDLRIARVTYTFLHVAPFSLSSSTDRYNISYTIEYENVGATTANAVTLVETLPSGARFLGPSALWATADGVTCTHAVSELLPAARGSVSFLIRSPDLAAGDSLMNVVRIENRDPANLDWVATNDEVHLVFSVPVSPTPSATAVDALTATPTPTPRLVVTAVSISPASSGWLSNANGTVHVLAPAGAVSTPVVLAYSPAPTPTPALLPRAGLVTLEAFDLSVQPEDPAFQFVQPIVIIVRYDSAAVARLAADSLAIAWVDAGGNWVSLPSRIDRDQGVVATEARSVGRFALTGSTLTYRVYVALAQREVDGGW